ncbi:MAG: transposase [Lutibacter sp.]|nr:MAG: transposase [Lutibacter sp.]
MKLEPLKPSLFYHFYNRGNNKENIFIKDDNYVYFLSLIKKHIIPIAEIYSYCLLPNHFHLIIKIKDENLLSDKQKNKIYQPFSNLFNAYTKAFNKKYNRTGSLFQKHPKRIIIDSDEYLKNLIIYVNTNSSHHSIADYNTYKHSSFQALISSIPTLLKRDDVIELFDSVENFKYILEFKKQNLETIIDLLFE